MNDTERELLYNLAFRAGLVDSPEPPKSKEEEAKDEKEAAKDKASVSKLEKAVKEAL